MNIFKVHESIITQYSKYVSSFTDIQDDRINEEVTSYFDNHRLWPQPLIQFNPAYAKGVFAVVVHERSEKLIEAHERFRKVIGGGRYKIVEPVLPPDLLGVYILMPGN